MHISLFGRLADLAGHRSLDIGHEIPATGLALRQWLAQSEPHLADILGNQGTRLVLNDEIVDWDSPLSANDTIAIIPIVSGG